MSTMRHSPGFTLIELLVVMGILTGFLMLLVQLVDGGLRLFGEGEAGQALADRASHVQRVLARELGALRGSPSGRDRDTVDDRLVVQWLPIGLPPAPERGATRVQVLRGAVHLEPERELVLLDAEVRTRLHREAPELGDAELEQRVAAAKSAAPLRGLGQLLLLPWRQEGGDEALLELRAAWLLPGQVVPLGPDRFVDPFEVPLPGSPELPGLLVHAITLPLLTDLLHLEFAFWGQATRGFDDGGGALRVWDSARGGWLVDEALGGVFPLDRGSGSAADPRDDVHPHAILVRAVAASPPGFPPEGLLAEPLAADETALVLYDGTRFPGPDADGFVKVRGEWVGYAARDGDVLRGLRRGARSTKPLDHPAGTRVHVGRTVEFVLPVAHRKDDWND